MPSWTPTRAVAWVRFGKYPRWSVTDPELAAAVAALSVEDDVVEDDEDEQAPASRAREATAAAGTRRRCTGPLYRSS
jgi:hypothetical protein